MNKLILLSAILFFSNVDIIIAQDFNDMSKKELRIEHFKKLKIVDSLSQELKNKNNENELLQIKIDSLNNKILSLNSNFNKVQVDLKLTVESLNKMTLNNDSIKNRIKELEIKLSDSNMRLANLQADSIESKSDKNNNSDICSLVNWQVKICKDIILCKSLYDFDENYFNTDIGKRDLLRLQKELKLIEKESDKFYEARDGRTEADVNSNIERMKTCLKYDELMEYEVKIKNIEDFIKEVMKMN
jgi:hypothetical protein